MRVQIDSKLLINSAHVISTISKELFDKEFKISKNIWGDYSVVKFENLKVNLQFSDQVQEKYTRKNLGQVVFKPITKSKEVATDIIISNNHMYLCGAEVIKIQLSSIKLLHLKENQFEIYTNNKIYKIDQTNFRLNIYLVTMLEWIIENKIDSKYDGKKIKFAAQITKQNL